jgi:hypothetical protein
LPAAASGDGSGQQNQSRAANASISRPNESPGQPPTRTARLAAVSAAETKKAAVTRGFRFL